jgi:octaprenyl-diphosphate synthase
MKALKQKILLAAEQELADIEAALSENLQPYLEIVSDVAGHIIFSGGKRLRPLLMVLSARICGYTGGYDITFSSAIEFLHAATLLHDDLVDDASLRRGKPVAHSVYGNAITVLVGDFLLARALAISADTGKLEVIKVISKLTEEMSQGEVFQLMRKGDISLSEDEYLSVIGQKTAVLFESACKTCAILADASDKQKQALSDYGYYLGIAFQMADDLLDYTQDTAKLGKEFGADLKEGKMTLPVIHALGRADDEDKEFMATIIKDQDFSSEDFEILVEKLEKYDGIDYTREMAASYIQKAKDALSIFESSETKELMFDIADYALARKM